MRADTHTWCLPGASLRSEARKARTLPRDATDMKYSVGISGPARPPRSAPRLHRRDRDRPGPPLPAPAEPRPAALGGPALTCGRRHSRLLPLPRTPPRVASAAAAARPVATAAQLPARSRLHAGPARPAPSSQRRRSHRRAGPGLRRAGPAAPEVFLAPSPSPPRPSAPLRHSRGAVGGHGGEGRSCGASPGGEGPAPAPPRAEAREAAAPRRSPRWREGPRRPSARCPGLGVDD